MSCNTRLTIVRSGFTFPCTGLLSILEDATINDYLFKSQMSSTVL